MKSSTKRVFNIVGPLLFLLGTAATMYMFEVHVIPKLNTEEILVVKNDLKFKEVITKEDLALVKINRDNVVKGAYKREDVNLVIGKNAAIDINKGTQLYESIIDSWDLIPNEAEGEFIASVPKNWLFAVPGSLRKAYIADFYAIPDEEQAVLRNLINEQTNPDTEVNEVETSTESQNEEVLASDSDGEIIETDEGQSEMVATTIKNKPILENVRVSSVKDGSNNEIIENPEEGNKTSGVISNLEIIANGEILDTLKEYTETGYKLYVVYKYER